MGENIYESPPIWFGNDSDEEEAYKRKQKEITKKLLDSTDSRNVTELLVKLIYGEGFYMPARLLDTKIATYGERVLELADAIEDIEWYNNFKGKDVADALRYLHNKGYVMEAKFGREYSPVLYINPPYWQNQASNYAKKYPENNRPYTHEERETMYRAIEGKLKPLEPDELDRTEYQGVRAWWD